MNLLATLSILMQLAMVSMALASFNINDELKHFFLITPVVHDRDNKQQELYDFYTLNNYQAVWLTDKGWSPTAQIIAAKILKSTEEGLWLENYQAIADLLIIQPTSPSEQLKAELAFSKIVLDYIDDLYGGRLHPSRIRHELYMNPEPVNAADVLYNILQRDSSGNDFAALTIHHPEYQALKIALQDFHKQSLNQNLYNKIPTDKTFKKGDKSAVVPIIVERLVNLKYLSDDQRSSTVFNAVIEDAIKKFQSDRHLEADGIMGLRTALLLNQNHQDYINHIIVSMERWRWLPSHLGDRYVQVNIAAFELKAYEHGQQTMVMPVIIGQNYRHTPVFASKIDEVRFNPFWHVPVSIAIKDKLKKLRDDPQTMADKGFTVYTKSGEALNPIAINWSNVDANNFNYHLVQSPGVHNALGKIRFNIDSPFGVYLHSTPDKYLFQKTVRNFSSGCIRVGEPNKLAVFVLNQPDIWTLKKVDEAMEGNETYNVKVKPAVPVYITYFTAWVDDQNRINFYDDIYEQDALILQELLKFKARKRD